MSDSEIVKEFLVESYENLDRLDRDLIALEKDPGNREILASVFRTIHTIKGTSGFLAFNKLEAVTHVGENLLSRLRDGMLTLNAEGTTTFLAMVDAVRQMLGSIEATGNEGERNDQELIATLTRLLQPKRNRTLLLPRRRSKRKPRTTICPSPHRRLATSSSARAQLRRAKLAKPCGSRTRGTRASWARVRLIGAPRSRGTRSTH